MSRERLVEGETVSDPLVFLHGDHRHHARAVREDEERDLLAGQELLQDELGPRGAELLVRHHLGHRRLCFRLVLDHHHALARGEAVHLEHERVAERALLHRLVRLLPRGADHVLRGGDLVAVHELPGEGLGAFDLRRRPAGAEDGEPAPLELVPDAEDHRQLGADDGEVRADRLGEVRDFDDVGGVDGDAVGEAGHAGVPGGAVDVLDERALPDLPDERMLTAAIPDDQDLHPRVSFLRCGIRKVCHAAEKSVKPERRNDCAGSRRLVAAARGATFPSETPMPAIADTFVSRLPAAAGPGRTALAAA
jgi:hypothetical protein